MRSTIRTLKIGAFVVATVALAVALLIEIAGPRRSARPKVQRDDHTQTVTINVPASPAVERVLRARLSASAAEHPEDRAGWFAGLAPDDAHLLESATDPDFWAPLSPEERRAKLQRIAEVFPWPRRAAQ